MFLRVTVNLGGGGRIEVRMKDAPTRNEERRDNRIARTGGGNDQQKRQKVEHVYGKTEMNVERSMGG